MLKFGLDFWCSKAHIVFKCVARMLSCRTIWPTIKHVPMSPLPLKQTLDSAVEAEGALLLCFLPAASSTSVW